MWTTVFMRSGERNECKITVINCRAVHYVALMRGQNSCLGYVGKRPISWSMWDVIFCSFRLEASMVSSSNIESCILTAPEYCQQCKINIDCIHNFTNKLKFKTGTFWLSTLSTKGGNTELVCTVAIVTLTTNSRQRQDYNLRAQGKINCILALTLYNRKYFSEYPPSFTYR